MSAHSLGLLLSMLLSALAILSGSGCRGAAPPTFRGTAVAPPGAAPEFLLTDHRGAPLSLRDLRGEVVLVFFGFTSCPSVCPTTLERARTAVDALDARDEVSVLLVTVDPATDTPPVLAGYLERFGDGFVGATGDPELLRQVRAAYGAWGEPDAAAPGGMGHTAALYGVDRDGLLRVVLPPDDGETLVADLATLLDLERRRP